MIVSLDKRFEGLCSVVKLDSCQEVTCKKSDHSILFTIPDDVLEWYVTVLDSRDSRVAHDWMDYYGNSQENMRNLMNEHVNRFLSLITENETRLMKIDKKFKTFADYVLSFLEGVFSTGKSDVNYHVKVIDVLVVKIENDWHTIIPDGFQILWETRNIT